MCWHPGALSGSLKITTWHYLSVEASNVMSRGENSTGHQNLQKEKLPRNWDEVFATDTHPQASIIKP